VLGKGNGRGLVAVSAERRELRSERLWPLAGRRVGDTRSVVVVVVVVVVVDIIADMHGARPNMRHGRHGCSAVLEHTEEACQ